MFWDSNATRASQREVFFRNSGEMFDIRVFDFDFVVGIFLNTRVLRFCPCVFFAVSRFLVFCSIVFFLLAVLLPYPEFRFLPCCRYLFFIRRVVRFFVRENFAVIRLWWFLSSFSVVRRLLAIFGG